MSHFSSLMYLLYFMTVNQFQGEIHSLVNYNNLLKYNYNLYFSVYTVCGAILFLDKTILLC